MQDAFGDGVKPGGLYTEKEIKILICYMLNGVGEPMPETAVTEILYSGEMANFFEVSAAVQELLQRGHLQEEDGLLSLTETGRQVASTLARMVPFTLRERSVEAAVKLMARQKRQRDTEVIITPDKKGCLVTCRICDGKDPLMEVTLRVGDEWQAKLIKERFLEEPTLSYRSLIAVLTGGVSTKRDDTRLIIDLC